MKTWALLWRREVGGFLRSPAAYLLWACFLALTGWTFWLLTDPLAESRAAAVLQQDFFRSLLFFQVLLLPMLALRCLSEERSSGTLETLLTAPVSDTAIILAKYAGVMTQWTLLLLSTAVYGFLLQRIDGQAALDPRLFWSGYAGLLLAGSLYAAVGLLAAAWAESPWVAGAVGLAAVLLLYLAGEWPFWARTAGLRETGALIAGAMPIRDFARGVFDTRPVIFHLSAAAWFLHAAVRVVESRHWK